MNKIFTWIIVALLALNLIGVVYLLSAQGNLGRFTDELQEKVFKNTVTLEGVTTATGDASFTTLIGAGASSSIAGTSSSVMTAAVACNGGFANVVPSITESSTLTFPTAETMFADCLDTIGDSVSVHIRNLNGSTTVLTAGTSSTLVYDTGGSATLAGSGYALVTLQRVTDILMIIKATTYIP